jgi:hypothetical protein
MYLRKDIPFNLPSSEIAESGSEEDFAGYDFYITGKVKARLIRALVNLLPLHSCRRLSEEKYHIHRSAPSDGCPYFSKMLSSICREIAQVSFDMDSAVDHKDAVKMFVEYLYTSAYMPPANWGFEVQDVLHSRVYVLAERPPNGQYKRTKLLGNWLRYSWARQRALEILAAIPGPNPDLLDLAQQSI